ncbi:MAG: class I SAM-dependent methyltransferase [Candidatus Electrothrix sp. GW3-4]|uniref:class I SAM-dependent methyltransferase n=1 Tax=Candidatus Electrothrix sp. GW3-4 TaxID=3126740 RepID=UPI0030CFDA71
MTTVRVDYTAHDAIYQKNKETGRPGWDTATGTAQTLLKWQEILQSRYIPDKGRVLELGCGAGDLSLWLTTKGYEVSGVDISPTAIDWAREKAQAGNALVDFHLGNVINLSTYQESAFDLVLDSHCLHCIIGDHRALFLRSAYRVLRPAGCCIIKTMCGRPAKGWSPGHFDPQTRCLIRKDGLATRYLGLSKDIMQEVVDAGFQLKEWKIRPASCEEDQGELLVYAIR